MKQIFFVVSLFEFWMHLSMAEEPYLMVDTPNRPQSEFCNKAMHMNAISRLFFCRLFPSLSLPFSRNRRNHRVIKNNNLDSIQSQALMDEMVKYNQDFDGHIPSFEQQEGYAYRHRYHIPATYAFGQQNQFPSKTLNEVSTNGFEGVAPFASSGQMIKPVSNSYESNKISTKSPLNTHVYGNPSPDLNLGPSINKEQSYQTSPYNSVSSIDYQPSMSRAHWWPNDKTISSDSRDREIGLNRGNHKKLQAVRSGAKFSFDVDSREGWTPISVSKNSNHLAESHNKKYTEKKPITYSSKMYTTRTSTSTPTPIKSDHFRKDYLIDVSKNDALVNNYGALNPNKSSIKSTKKTHTVSRPPVIKKDLSVLTTQLNEGIKSSSAETTTPLTTPETKIIVRKEHKDFTKSSVIYSVEDSIPEQTEISEQKDNSSIGIDNKLNHDYIYDDTELKENIEPEEVYEISAKYSKKSNETSSVGSEPWHDYPMYSPLASSNFSCTNPGFYADKGFGCQVYHHCGSDNYHQKFICPNGTLFNDQIQSCDYWFNVNCEKITKSIEISFDKKVDHINLLTNNSEPTSGITLAKPIDVDRNQTFDKLMENLRNFVENVKLNAFNKTETESEVDNETKH